MPIQYRDYPLFWYMAVVVCLVAFAHGAPPLQAVELTFDQPCCVASACPVVTALTKLADVSELKHLPNSKGTKVVMRTAKAVSPRDLWSTVTAAHQPPLRMTIDRETFTANSFN